MKRVLVLAAAIGMLLPGSSYAQDEAIESAMRAR
jgi:hypothetical protein